jgi:signal transduction histidine kinase
MAEDFRDDITAIAAIEAVPHILDVVCQITGMGFAAVARVTGERWVALAVKDEISFGLKPGGELKVDTTICHEVRDSGNAVIIDNVAEDRIYCAHPTPKLYGFQSYISVPIVLANGRLYGTLCAIDPKPRKLNTPQIAGMFKLFAELIALQLEASAKLTASQFKLATSEARLLDARHSSELREQFIAVLGHDLRNPLASIGSGVSLLLRDKPPEKTREILTLMRASVQRMSALIDNVLDFAHGRLGGGIKLRRDGEEPLAPVLKQVISELQSAHSSRAIEASIELDENVNCDRARIGQLFSNLLGNALKHGAADVPVRVRATTAGGKFILSVANGGAPISEATRAKLFAPFYRGEVRKSQGLGLGLYIASEIAKEHGGTLDVASDATETCFTFTMPLIPASSHAPGA